MPRGSTGAREPSYAEKLGARVRQKQQAKEIKKIKKMEAKRAKQARTQLQKTEGLVQEEASRETEHGSRAEPPDQFSKARLEEMQRKFAKEFQKETNLEREIARRALKESFSARKAREAHESSRLEKGSAILASEKVALRKPPSGKKIPKSYSTRLANRYQKQARQAKYDEILGKSKKVSSTRVSLGQTTRSFFSGIGQRISQGFRETTSLPGKIRIPRIKFGRTKLTPKQKNAERERNERLKVEKERLRIERYAKSGLKVTVKKEKKEKVVPWDHHGPSALAIDNRAKRKRAAKFVKAPSLRETALKMIEITRKSTVGKVNDWMVQLDRRSIHILPRDGFRCRLVERAFLKTPEGTSALKKIDVAREEDRVAEMESIHAKTKVAEIKKRAEGLERLLPVLESRANDESQLAARAIPSVKEKVTINANRLIEEVDKTKADLESENQNIGRLTALVEVKEVNAEDSRITLLTRERDYFWSLTRFSGISEASTRIAKTFYRELSNRGRIIENLRGKKKARKNKKIAEEKAREYAETEVKMKKRLAATERVSYRRARK